jgi:hypothetical protein
MSYVRTLSKILKEWGIPILSRQLRAKPRISTDNRRLNHFRTTATPYKRAFTGPRCEYPTDWIEYFGLFDDIAGAVFRVSCLKNFAMSVGASDIDPEPVVAGFGVMSLRVIDL